MTRWLTSSTTLARGVAWRVVTFGGRRVVVDELKTVISKVTPRQKHWLRRWRQCRPSKRTATRPPTSGHAPSAFMANRGSCHG